MAGSQWERQGTDDTVAAKLFTLPTIKMRSRTTMIRVMMVIMIKELRMMIMILMTLWQPNYLRYPPSR